MQNFFVDRYIEMNFFVDRNIEMQNFFVDRYIEMNFFISEYAIPIYTNLSMANKMKIDSGMNGLRYKRLNEIKTISLIDLKGKTMRELCREYI